MACAAAPGAAVREKHRRQLLKTEMCKFFPSNRCAKGASCPFAHDPSEIREKPDLAKTSMCRAFLQTGRCDRPGCAFAHDERELRSTPGFFKTKLCRFASAGRCKHRPACRFAHSAAELAQEKQQEQQHQQLQQLQAAAAQCARAQLNGPVPGRDAGSDTSTRAETAGGSQAPTLDSGDSGQEDRSPADAVPRRPAAGGTRSLRNGVDRNSSRQYTTLLLTNVPTFLTQGALLSMLEDLTVCARGSCDFFYCPWNASQDENLGYAILNFVSCAVAAEFERIWSNKPLFPGRGNAKRLRIAPAALQGLADNVQHFSGFSLARNADPRFRPLVRRSPNDELAPMADLSLDAPAPVQGAALARAREVAAPPEAQRPRQEGARVPAAPAALEDERHALIQRRNELQQLLLHLQGQATPAAGMHDPVGWHSGAGADDGLATFASDAPAYMLPSSDGAFYASMIQACASIDASAVPVSVDGRMPAFGAPGLTSQARALWGLGLFGTAAGHVAGTAPPPLPPRH